MQSSTIAISGVLLALLVLGAGIIVLQIFLSKRENKWLGLILPIIALCISIVAVLSIASYTALTTTHEVTSEAGQEITTETLNVTQIMPTSQMIFMVVSVFLMYNIPTVVLLVIYFACCEKQRQRKLLAKMQALDLE